MAQDVHVACVQVVVRSILDKNNLILLDLKDIVDLVADLGVACLFPPFGTRFPLKFVDMTLVAAKDECLRLDFLVG